SLLRRQPRGSAAGPGQPDPRRLARLRRRSVALAGVFQHALRLGTPPLRARREPPRAEVRRKEPRAVRRDRAGGPERRTVRSLFELLEFLDVRQRSPSVRRNDAALVAADLVRPRREEGRSRGGIRALYRHLPP